MQHTPPHANRPHLRLVRPCACIMRKTTPVSEADCLGNFTRSPKPSFSPCSRTFGLGIGLLSGRRRHVQPYHCGHGRTGADSTRSTSHKTFTDRTLALATASSAAAGAMRSRSSAARSNSLSSVL